MANPTWYKDKTPTAKWHSIDFGYLNENELVGTYNTWNNWHLIPPSRPAITHPPFVTKYIEIPGMHGYLDLTDYLTGRAVYGARTGTLQFIIDNDHENWETIRMSIVKQLHGKVKQMRLVDDPKYYYTGRFTVGNFESGQERSAISISYQLDPFKRAIRRQGIDDIIWDEFNFETDYDYYPIFHEATVSGSGIHQLIYEALGPISLSVQCISGSVTAEYGGVQKSISAGNTEELGTTYEGNNYVTVTGNGVVNIFWRELSL